MKIAIQGCCHGSLDNIYADIQAEESRSKIKVDLLLICGDFQAIRNDADLECMAVPVKYRQLGDFYKYYSGAKKAPVPTLFIGGNHEASNYLWELYHGGWVAENIFYLGHAGVVNFNGVRIGGLSGIYKSFDYKLGQFAMPPYQEPVRSLKSAYHTREYDVRKMLQVKNPIDIFLSHDWPRGIERYGDVQTLLKKKPFFRAEVERNDLGSPANELLLKTLMPRYWYSAHLHVHFSATVAHGPVQQEQNPDEIMIPDDSDSEDEKGVSQQEAKTTEFLALDKCGRGRRNLHYMDIESTNDQGLQYDLEWLAITRAMQPYLSLEKRPLPIPNDDDLNKAIKEQMDILQKEADAGTLSLEPAKFEQTAPAILDGQRLQKEEKRRILETAFVNPQTTHVCNLLSIENKVNAKWH
ncbi:lariat debranching enzyme, C-terminal domain-domain-containing protein [Syncephalastrum racemosum]|uniref:Lariat debranching enzyme, C-terminal domain-domain-containing protein n=1 Tax=Syncephalastrum racemosum TaxID=13706 RepID=A0A1X2HEC7_SYNRA|nr:lariat debranching enzyme, C-terminal domain-domain-containing protein [Syncephalastrum racemosum]